MHAGSGEYDYPLISYFGRFRFSYFRLNSWGHNTLSFDGALQDQKVHLCMHAWVRTSLHAIVIV